MKLSLRGNVLITIVLLIAVFSITIPALLFYVTHESKWAVKEKKSTAAFQLAEAGIDRGLWKLKESSDNWDNIPVSGYNFDRVYSDIPSTSNPIGYYTISITLGTTDNERKIIAIGKDTASREVRAIEVTVSREAVSAAVQAGLITYGGSAEIHWGPIFSLGNIDVSGSADKFFPRKFARGQITCNKESHSHDDDEAGPPTSGPNVSGEGIDNRMEWYSQYAVPNMPDVNLIYYKEQAQIAGHYYAADKNFNNYEDAAETVHYCENNATIKNCFLWGVVIVKGKCTMQGGGRGGYDAIVPVNAYREYECGTQSKPKPDDNIGDTDVANEYPGDAGGPGDSGDGTGTHALTQVSVNGFVYVGSNLSVTGNTTINGAVLVVSASADTGNLTIYYRDNLDVKMINTDFTITSWKEIVTSWP